MAGCPVMLQMRAKGENAAERNRARRGLSDGESKVTRGTGGSLRVRQLMIVVRLTRGLTNSYLSPKSYLIILND